MSHHIPGLKAAICVCALWVAGCIAPEDTRPGLWLPGETTRFASDWSFTDAHREIGLQVTPPYFVAHSVTIWCVSVDGSLFIAARNPDSKNWPGWVRSQPDIKLGIDGKVYEGTLAELDDSAQIEKLRAAYVAKYELNTPPPAGTTWRYWQVEPRG